MYRHFKVYDKSQYGVGNCSDTPITVLEALELILRAIDNREGFTFTRVGDGEIHLLRNDRPNLTKHIASKFGMTANELLGYMRPKIRSVLAESDLLGMASPLHDIKPANWILPRRDFVDMAFVRQWKYSNRLLGRIFKEPVRIISCNPINKEMPFEYNLTQISNPTTKEEAEDVINRDYYEQVILWGGGALLKNLGVEQKKKGHVCIDLGKTLDSWYTKT